MYSMLIFLMGLLMKFNGYCEQIILDSSEVWQVVITYKFQSHTVKLHHRHGLEYFSVHVIKDRYDSRKIYELKTLELIDFLNKYKEKAEGIAA